MRSRSDFARAFPAFAISSTTFRSIPPPCTGSSARATQLCHRALHREHPACLALEEIAGALRRLPRRTNRRPAALAARRDAAPTILGRLRDLSATVPEIGPALAEAAAVYTDGADGQRRLRRLLDAQVYRLAHWRRAAREINYRRFFDVNDLVALHMEDPEVFAETHALVLAWRRRGLGGRVPDRPPGRPARSPRLLPAAGGGGLLRGRPLHRSVVEKILSPAEQLRTDWPVAGTTGYDFLNQAEALFIAPDGLRGGRGRLPPGDPAAAGVSGDRAPGKRLVLETGLSAGVRRLADRLLKLRRAGARRRLRCHGRS